MKKQLLATVSGIVLMGAAHGADMAPAYKAAAPVLAPTWAGFYLGVQGGAVRHEASFNNTDGFFNSPTTYNTSKTGGLAGGYAGYNWQDRSFVYGIESDISWVGAKAATTWGGDPRFNFTFPQSQDVAWLATFRARAGIDFESTLFYLTGGLAVARLNQSFNGFNSLTCNPCNGVPGGAQFAGFSENKTMLGWTAGVGFEHMFDRHWTVRGEFRYVDLGRSTVSCVSVAQIACNTGTTYHGDFSNSLITGMVGVGYKF